MKVAAGTLSVAALALLAAYGPGASVEATQVSSAPFVTIGGIMAAGAPMNIYAASSLEMPGMDIMPLAISHNSANLGAFYPALAWRWSLSKNGRTVTVWLRKARWSNGQPVTATDVKTTLACSYAVGQMQGYGLGSVKVLGPREIQMTLSPGVQSNTFLFDVLTTNIVPNIVFGPLLPSDVWSLISQSQYQGTNAALKSKATAALTQLTALGTKISGFSPVADVSSGPFVIQAVNPGELIMRKNPYFWAAKNIKVNEVIRRNFTGSQEQWNYAISGQVDELTGTYPVNIYDQAKKTPGNVFYKAPAYTLVALIFNEHIYPYNLVAVRKAFAYLINWQNIRRLSNPISGGAPKYTDGMVDAATQQWLTPAQTASLHRYRTSATKAADLLKGAGFKKVGGQWMMPNGKPWTVSISTVSQFSSFMVSSAYMKSVLTAFGIPTKVVGMTFPQMLSAQSQGQLAVSFRIDGQGPDPYFAYNRIYGSADGYVLRGGKLTRYPASDAAGGNFVDFPATVTLPGYGKVNPGQLTQQLNSSTNPAVVRRDTQILAMVTNQYVPQITMWNVFQTGFVNTQNFTDYPTNNPKLLIAAEGFYPPVGIWMMEGYIHPKG